jgi:hypothetical protein
MKRIFTLILAVTSLTAAFGQSIKIFKGTDDVTNKTITLPVSAYMTAETFLSLVNTTSSKINYNISRTINNGAMVDDSCAELSFCTGATCYPPHSDIYWAAPNPGTIDGYQTLKDAAGVTAHYTTCPDHCRDLYVTYNVYKTDAGSKDTAKVTIQYTCTTGIHEEKAASAFISDAYPNPVSTDFSVSYHMNSFANSQITITDILGKRVKEVKLTEKEGTVTINTTQLREGIYFYSLIVNNQVTATKKIVIRY